MSSITQTVILSPKRSYEKGDYPRSTGSPTRMWQTSSMEANFSPVQHVPNIRDDLVPYVVRRAQTSQEKRSPTLPKNYDHLDFHEKLYYSGRMSPSALTTAPASPVFKGTYKNAVLLDDASPTKVCLGHEFTQKLSPGKEHLEAYGSGASIEEAPFRVVTHNKRGVKLPKIAGGKSATNICRTYSGGFYAHS